MFFIGVLANLFYRESKPPLDCVAMAQRIIANGMQDEDIEAFMKAAHNRKDVLLQRTQAYRMLMEAGSEKARNHLYSISADSMGDMFLEIKEHAPAVIEYAVAYLHGRGEGFQAIAFSIEDDGFMSPDTKGFKKAVADIAKMQTSQEVVDHFTHKGFYCEKSSTIVEMRKLADENPLIFQALRADLLVFRAYYANQRGDRDKALALRAQAYKNGVTSELEKYMQLQNILHTPPENNDVTPS